MRLWFHSVPTPMMLKRIFFWAASLARLRQVCSPEVSPSVRTITCDSLPTPTSFSTSAMPMRMPWSMAVPPGSTSNMSTLLMTSSIWTF